MKPTALFDSRAVAVLTCLAALSCGPVRNVEEAPPPSPVAVTSATCPSPLLGENVRITTAIGESNSPVVEWSSDAFTIAWWDMRGRFPSVHVVRTDKEGVARSRTRMMPHEGIAREQTLAADASETHLAWIDEDTVMSARLATTETPAVAVALKASAPVAGPWGALAWESRGNLLFTCDGMRAGGAGEGEIGLTPTVLYRGGIESPSMAWSNKHYAVAWSASVKGGRQILMQMVSNKGTLIGETIRVSGTAGVSRNPVVVWTGEEFAVAWTNAAPESENPRDRFRVFFAVVPALGSAPRLTRQLEFNGSADQVALETTGAEHAVSWVGSKAPMGSAVYFQRLTKDGLPIGETLRVTDDAPLTCGRPSLAWAGDGYGVVWHDDRDAAGSEVFFSFLECGEDERDADDAGPKDGGAGHPAPRTETPAQDPPPALKKLFD